MKRLWGPLLLIGCLVLTAGWTSIVPGESVRHQSGVEVLGPLPTPAAPSYALARAWTDALLLSEVYPDFGYPWANTASGELVVTTTSSSAQALAGDWISGRAASLNYKGHALAKPQVPVIVRSASQNYGRLESVKGDVTHLVQTGLADADAIYEAAPDWEHNRLVLTLSRQSDALISALAARYGAETFAVRVAARPYVVPLTRTHDYSPFYGGAIIFLANASLPNGGEGCSSGFSWTDSYGTQYMLTAGHCVPLGSSDVYTTDAAFNRVDNMGTVAENTRENWNNGTGTVLFPGDSTYRGDVALVQMYSSKSGGAFMYSGMKPDETSASTVHNMWTTVPAAGEQYCTGGSNTYANCGWTVSTARTNYLYSTGEWARNVTTGIRSSGLSGNKGDSGGPVYTVNGTGTIAAKGIISGGTIGPTSCSYYVSCVNVFTDILLPYYYFPGWLKTL